MGKRFGQREMISLTKKVALLAPAASRALGPGTGRQKLAFAVEDYTGYSIDAHTWKPERLLTGWGPYLGVKVVEFGLKLLGKIS